MNNPEFEPEILENIDTKPVGVDISGYSEKRTDIQIDKKDDGQQGAKQFNRLVKAGTFVPPKKVKKVVIDNNEDNVVFNLKKGI